MRLLNIFTTSIALLGRVAWIGMLTGCVFMLPSEPPLEEAPATELPAAQAEPEPAPSALLEPRTPIETLPAPPPAREIPPPPPPTRVIVLLPPDVNGFESTLSDLERRLNLRQFDIVRLSTGDVAAQHALADDPQRATFIVAVGSDAARIAIEDLRLPTVYCQVPDEELGGADVYGVATMPPLELQLRGWKQLDPSLSRVGLILSRQEYLLAAQAHKAAAALGLSLDLQVAGSDQEALYLFKRLAPQIDGLWLLPDNAILSPRVLKEMLNHARSRGLQSLAFTPALLDWGALLSVRGTAANTAGTLAAVIERLAAGEAEAVPPVTPLSELEVQVNTAMADRLGLHPPAPAWIVREGDT